MSFPNKDNEDNGKNLRQAPGPMECGTRKQLSPFEELIWFARRQHVIKKNDDVSKIVEASNVILLHLDKLDPDEQHRMKTMLVKIHEAVDQPK